MKNGPNFSISILIILLTDLCFSMFTGCKNIDCLSPRSSGKGKGVDENPRRKQPPQLAMRNWKRRPYCGQSPVLRQQIADFRQHNPGRNFHLLNATPGSVPWIVSIRAKREKKHLCTGVFIHSDEPPLDPELIWFVITVGHCFKSNREYVDVVAGIHTLIHESSTITADVTEVLSGEAHRHDNFVNGRHVNDIALIRLHNPINRTLHPNLQQLCLPNTDEENKRPFVAGWPPVTLMDVRYPLQVSTAKLATETRQCEMYPDYRDFDMICATRYGGPSGSGDPLFTYHERSFVLEGLASHGFGSHGSTPTVYTKIRAHGDWIRRTIGVLRMIRE